MFFKTSETPYFYEYEKQQTCFSGQTPFKVSNPSRVNISRIIFDLNTVQWFGKSHLWLVYFLNAQKIYYIVFALLSFLSKCKHIKTYINFCSTPEMYYHKIKKLRTRRRQEKLELFLKLSQKYASLYIYTRKNGRYSC